MKFSVHAGVVFISLVAMATSFAQAPKEKLPARFGAILANADSVELYSIDPFVKHDRKDPAALHGWKVLGKTEVDAETRQKLVAALKKGIEEGDPGKAAFCFIPRHALRVVRARAITDFLICFECGYVEVYSGQKTATKLLFTSTQQPAFDAAITAAKVQLAPKTPPKE
jgi:hypothetical protein